MYGGTGDDNLTSKHGTNHLYGGAGNDTLVVDTRLYASYDTKLLNTTVAGGVGRDLFIFKTGFDLPGNSHVSSNTRITDFDVRFDKLVLDSAVDGRGAISSVQFSRGDTILTLNDPTSTEKATITLVGVDKNEWSRIDLA
jgi:Ca2+-binding RTX toxin-like protein